MISEKRGIAELTAHKPQAILHTRAKKYIKSQGHLSKWELRTLEKRHSNSLLIAIRNINIWARHYSFRVCRRCLDEIERGRGIPARVRLVAALEVELNARHTAAGRVLTHPRYSAWQDAFRLLRISTLMLILLEFYGILSLLVLKESSITDEGSLTYGTYIQYL
jgi:hypothetical protein